MPASQEPSSTGLLAAACGCRHRPAAGWDAGGRRGERAGAAQGGFGPSEIKHRESAQTSGDAPSGRSTWWARDAPGEQQEHEDNTG